jgi:hypothetical protein
MLQSNSKPTSEKKLIVMDNLGTIHTVGVFFMKVAKNIS